MKKIIIFFITLVVLILAVLIVGYSFLSSSISDLLWLKSVEYLNVFYNIIRLKAASFILPFIFFLLFSYIWFYFVRGIKRNPVLSLIIWLLAIVYGILGFINWRLLLIKPEGIAGYKDPLFSLDAYNYMFRLPLFQVVLFMLLTYFWILFILNLILHKEGKKAGIREGKLYFQFTTVFLYIIAVIAGLSYYFSRVMEIMISQPNPRLGIDFTAYFGFFYGAVLWMIFIILVAMIWLFKSKKGLGILSLILYGGLLVLLYFGLTGLYPYLLNTIYVKPNELMAQKRFVKYRIEATRKAFSLNMSPVYYPRYDKLDDRFTEILSTLRIWDSDPYKRVIEQVQTIKTYFNFNDVDNDVYRVGISGNHLFIPGSVIQDYSTQESLMQVSIAARELNINSLPSDAMNWDNIHLRYTHGYGVAASPTHIADKEGNPVFWVGNLDQKASFSNLTVDEPQIYFGENTSNYIIVNSTADEFEYTASTNRITTRYKMDRGVKLDNILKKLLYSSVMKEKNILLSQYIKKDSRIIYNRGILERVKKIFPYLEYDSDPYITIIEGKLYWILDAYTVSARFPLSEMYNTPFGRLNYIRNSVKVVINAYSGDTFYYIVDDTDPIVETYNYLFPGFFKKEIPAEFKEHFRYPYALLKIQSDVLCRYHVDNEDSFYNGDDVWEIPKQIYGDKTTNFEPYYMIALFETNKTGEITNCKPHFSAVQPFNPRGRENLASWALAYYDDGLNLNIQYVENISSSLGPMQVESKINQDDRLSGLFTLWSQKGSKIFRGNVKFLPINDDILYIVPIFLESESSSIPQLVRIVAVYNNAVYVGSNYHDLAQAIAKGLQ